MGGVCVELGGGTAGSGGLGWFWAGFGRDLGAIWALSGRGFGAVCGGLSGPGTQDVVRMAALRRAMFVVDVKGEEKKNTSTEKQDESKTRERPSGEQDDR